MDKLLQWTVDVELAAAQTYRLAAEHFAADAGFSMFLTRLAEEEEWHARLLTSAAIVLREQSPVLPDLQTSVQVGRLFSEAQERLRQGEMTAADMYRLIVAAEFSEWNEFFLYALGLLRADNAEFARAVAEIERHKEQIVAYFTQLPDGGRYLPALIDLPQAGDKRILLVSRQQVLTQLLREALSPIGAVVVAESGPEGLARIEQQAFDVILTDVDMEAMDSLEFYQHVVGVDPAFSGRCIFFAGGGSSAALLANALADGPASRPAFVEQLCRTVAGVARGATSQH